MLRAINRHRAGLALANGLLFSTVGFSGCPQQALNAVDGFEQSHSNNAAVSSFVSPGSELMFNPQPEPPAGLSPGGDRMFNPQPEPPAGLSPGGDRMFNPQPEPPAGLFGWW